MELSSINHEIVQRGNLYHVLQRLRRDDLQTDILLEANVMDILLTYVVLQRGTLLTEFNAIIYAVMNTIGTGADLFFKIILCLGILWI
ncbi:hypothetical protein ACFLVM_00775 [Chloroflexota bacterium]